MPTRRPLGIGRAVRSTTERHPFQQSRALAARNPAMRRPFRSCIAGLIGILLVSGLGDSAAAGPIDWLRSIGHPRRVRVRHSHHQTGRRQTDQSSDRDEDEGDVSPLHSKTADARNPATPQVNASPPSQSGVRDNPKTATITATPAAAASAMPSPAPSIRPAKNADPATSQPSDLPFGVPVANKPGFVISPFSPNGGYVDVRGMPSGIEVKDPYTGKVFRTP